MMEWVLMPLRRYADFSGRSRRKEYWLFLLGQIILFSVLLVLFLLLLPSGAWNGVGDFTPRSLPSLLVFLAGLLAILGLVIPTIAVQVRRLHDQDKSGWLWLLHFVPYLGGFIILIFMCIEGTRGTNRYGPDPVAENLADTFR